MRLLKHGKWALPAFLAAIALGILISVQLQIQKKVNAAKAVNDQKVAAVQKLVEKAAQQKQLLLNQQKELKKKVDMYRDKPGEVSPDVKAQIATIGILSGETPVEGPGIHIEIDDRKVSGPYTLTDHLLQIVNILKYAGAEAIEVNGQRIGARSYISSSGPTSPLVNGVPISRVGGTHWEVEAIGNQEVLKSYVQTVIDPYTSTFPDLSVIVTAQLVQIPGLKTLEDFTFAKPVQ